MNEYLCIFWYNGDSLFLDHYDFDQFSSSPWSLRRRGTFILPMKEECDLQSTNLFRRMKKTHRLMIRALSLTHIHTTHTHRSGVGPPPSTSNVTPVLRHNVVSFPLGTTSFLIFLTSSCLTVCVCSDMVLLSTHLVGS